MNRAHSPRSRPTEPAKSRRLGAEPRPTDVQPIEAELAAGRTNRKKTEQSEEEEEPEETKRKKPSKLPAYLEWGGVVGCLAAIILVLAVVKLHRFLDGDLT